MVFSDDVHITHKRLKEAMRRLTDSFGHAYEIFTRINRKEDIVEIQFGEFNDLNLNEVFDVITQTGVYGEMYIKHIEVSMQYRQVMISIARGNPKYTMITQLFESMNEDLGSAQSGATDVKSDFCNSFRARILQNDRDAVLSILASIHAQLNKYTLKGDHAGACPSIKAFKLLSEADGYNIRVLLQKTAIFNEKDLGFISRLGVPCTAWLDGETPYLQFSLERSMKQT